MKLYVFSRKIEWKIFHSKWRRLIDGKTLLDLSLLDVIACPLKRLYVIHAAPRVWTNYTRSRRLDVVYSLWWTLGLKDHGDERRRHRNRDFEILKSEACGAYKKGAILKRLAKDNHWRKDAIKKHYYSHLRTPQACKPIQTYWPFTCVSSKFHISPSCEKTYGIWKWKFIE